MVSVFEDADILHAHAHQAGDLEEAAIAEVPAGGLPVGQPPGLGIVYCMKPRGVPRYRLQPFGDGLTMARGRKHDGQATPVFRLVPGLEAGAGRAQIRKGRPPHIRQNLQIAVRMQRIEGLVIAKHRQAVARVERKAYRPACQLRVEAAAEKGKRQALDQSISKCRA